MTRYPPRDQLANSVPASNNRSVADGVPRFTAEGRSRTLLAPMFGQLSTRFRRFVERWRAACAKVSTDDASAR